MKIIIKEKKEEFHIQRRKIIILKEIIMEIITILIMIIKKIIGDLQILLNMINRGIIQIKINLYQIKMLK